MYLADLHIHSKYSRATSRDADAPHLDFWARRKGIGLIGTGDFTHPVWREELKNTLIPAEEGFYRLKEELCLTDQTGMQPPRFVVTGEISSIYKKGGKTRKVHSLILLPGLEAADRLARRLERIGNVHSDGRPILGLDCKDLLEITLEACPEAVFIPAHIWTPHFSLFGAFSGFDTLEECFEDLSGEISALETGLSSDPPMNWTVSALDRFTLVSNSDAHSPQKLGREANLLETGLSYSEMARAIKTGEGFGGTIEFFPEEGKYHLDGHRSCGLCLTPEETQALEGRCPVCGKKITIGVLNRVFQLSDREEGFRPPAAKPFIHLVPLPELIARANGEWIQSKRTQQLYERMLQEFGSELEILQKTPIEAVKNVAGPCVAEGLRRLREGRVERSAGYDGEYGKISLFDPAERRELMGQRSWFITEKKDLQKVPARIKASPEPATREEVLEIAFTTVEETNREQKAAICAEDAEVAVIAGPGTGKTKTLIARIAHLIEKRGVKPTSITAVTFTNQAAAEMRERLEKRLGGKRKISGITIGTFHAICLKLLDKKPLLGENEALLLLQGLAEKAKTPAKEALRGISRVKGGMSFEQAGVREETYRAYCARCAELGVRDLDDLLLDALALKGSKRRMFTHLLVDEFQDLDDLQRALVAKWRKEGESLFVIGDPDQSIYGFRGASAQCFEKLAFPALRTITLKQNYRSTPQIISAAKSVIANNPAGERQLEAVNAPGAPVRLVRAENAFAEGVFIAKEIARMTGGMDMLSAGQREAGDQALRAFSEIAVLSRTHRQLETIEACLRHDDIPCLIFGREEYLDDPAVRGAVAFFRLLQNPRDIATLRICLTTTAKVSDAEAKRVCALYQDKIPVEKSMLLAMGCAEGFVADWESYAPRLAKEKPSLLIGSWAAEHGGGEAMERLLNAAAQHSKMSDFLETLTLGKEADIRRMSGRGYASGAVRLMTLHGAKGLEFPVVFLAGLNEKSLPLERTDRPTDVEEERRLFFVGMTRAREELILTAPQPGSCFLKELNADVLTQKAEPRQATLAAKQLRLF